MRLRNKLVAAGCIVTAAAALVAGSACNEHALAPFSKSVSAGKLQNFSSGSARAVDILFVIDNSQSMSEEQGGLDANFKKFLDRLIDANADFHLAAVTTEWPGNKNVEFVTDSMSKNYSGNDYLHTPREVLKGLSSSDLDAIEKRCAEYFGKKRRYISSTDEEIAKLEGDARKDYIQDLFRCEAIVGAKSSDAAAVERGLATAVAALENGSNDQPGAFKRDGSILTIVFVTDENDCSGVFSEEDGANGFTGESQVTRLKYCETHRNIEDSCTVAREDRVVTDKQSGSSLRLASGNIIEHNGKSLTTRQWCVQGDEEARAALTKALDECVAEFAKQNEEEVTDDSYKKYAQQCKDATSIDCPDGRCKNELNSRRFFFEKVLSLVIKTNEKHYRTVNAEQFEALEGDEDRKAKEEALLRSFAKQDVIIANVINRDRGVRSDEGVNDKWCGNSGNPSYRYQWFAEMFENDPIYAPICCRREVYQTMASGASSSDSDTIVCKKDDNGSNANFGPVLGLIGKRIGEAINTLCTDTAPLTCHPKDCNVPNENGIGYKNEPLDKPKAACPCLYGCNTKANWAGTDREYYLCNEFRFNIGSISESATILSSEDPSYKQYTEGEDYTINYESSYCYTRTSSPIQINLQKSEAGRKLVLEYPKRVGTE